MYNDTLKVANKIISYDDLFDIFTKMQEKLIHYQKVSNNEEMQNKMLEYNYQKWTFKDSNSQLTFNVNFYDDTSIKFDNYNNFIGIFNNRLHEIKDIYVYFVLSYSTQEEGQQSKWYSQNINMWIYETKVEINTSLDSSDKKMEDIYEFIKNKILNAPIKYDNIIKKKSSISTIVGLAIGLIPGLIISTLLMFIPTIREIFANSYVLYPICVIVLAFVIGGTIASSKLDKLYKNIIPEQKYAGYDSTNYKSIYKDDIDKYVETSEILIGKNVDNLRSRQLIMENYDKYKKYLLPEIIILIVLSIIVLFF